MNTVLLYITLAFFAVVVVTMIVILVGASSARRNAVSELEPPTDTAPQPRYRRS